MTDPSHQATVLDARALGPRTLVPSIRPRIALAGAELGGVAFVTAWVAAFLGLLLINVGKRSVNSFTGACQLVASSAGASVDLAGEVTAHLPVLSVLAAAAFGAAFRARRRATAWRATTLAERSVAALVAGTVFAAVATAAAAAFPYRVTGSSDLLGSALMVDGEQDALTIQAASVSGFLTVLLVFGLVALAVIAVVASTGERPPRPTGTVGAFTTRMAAAGRHLAHYVGAVTALTLVVAVAFALFGPLDASSVLAVPLVLGNLVVWALGMGHLSPAELRSTFTGELMSGNQSETSRWMVFQDEFSPWGTILLVGVAAVFILAAVVSAKRVPAPKARAEAIRNVVASAAAWALLGLVLSLLARLSEAETFDGDGFSGGVSLTLGLPAWTFAVFAAWGALFEGLRIVLTPAAVRLVPDLTLRIPGLGVLSTTAVPVEEQVDEPVHEPVDSPVAEEAVEEPVAEEAAEAAYADPFPRPPGPPMSEDELRRLYGRPSAPE